VAVPSYLVETYLAQGNTAERTAREARARSAAEALSRAGTRVSFQRAFHLPADEICFFVFAAPSSRDAELAAERAELGPIRVVEAIPTGEENSE
jgi:hypothetical protein